VYFNFTDINIDDDHGTGIKAKRESVRYKDCKDKMVGIYAYSYSLLSFVFVIRQSCGRATLNIPLRSSRYG